MKAQVQLKSKRGQNTAEYLIMLTLVAIGSIGLMTAFGKTIQSKIAYVSSAIAGGYLILCVSGYVFHLELGRLVALAMVVSSFATVTLLPALALMTRPAFLFDNQRLESAAFARKAG